MTLRKKKILAVQIFIFFIAIFLINNTYNDNKSNNSFKLSSQNNEEELASENVSSNIFENIEYKGIDLNGNRYVIKSEKAQFELESPELINMNIMSAIFYFNDGKILKIRGDHGTYNNNTYDMTFRENIKAEYENNILYADNLDYINTKGKVSIYGNVSTESIQGLVKADSLEIDLSAETLNISMFDENKVRVKVKK